MNNIDNLNLYELLDNLWLDRILITIITFIFAIGSIAYSLSIPNKYTSYALLAPSVESDILSSQLSSYSSLAGLAGINLPSNSVNSSDEAIARIKSLNFFENHFLPNINLENLVAVNSWDSTNNKLLYNEKIFNDGKWIRKTVFPQKAKPSSQEAFEIYDKSLNIDKDTLTGFITISFEHHSSHIAKNWVDIIINQINLVMQEIDKSKSIEAIEFLNLQMNTVKYSELREAIAMLLESQMEILMTTSISKGYVLKTIEPPSIPEKKSSPNRSIICILVTIFGFMLAVLLSLGKARIKSLNYV